MGGVRIVIAPVIGFIVYAIGLMGLVFLWFMRRDTPVQGIEHAVNVALLLLLAVIASQVTVWIVGKHKAVGLLGLLVIIVGIGLLNLSLGRAIEPSWFTTLEMITASGVIVGRVLRTRRTDMQAPDSDS